MAAARKNAKTSRSVQPVQVNPEVRLRPLEREDLHFVHQIDNNASVMRYWFEEPFETFAELAALYEEHIHDQGERRFVVEYQGQKAGLVELVEIDLVHRRAEFQIIIAPDFQGRGLATQATRLAMDYAFSVLNLYKLYLIVDKDNKKASHIYSKLGFKVEGELIHEFFVNGEYRNVVRMYLFQHDYLKKFPRQGALLRPTAQ
ncbi:spermidine N1-acetyltransferase [Lampropedia cohaerens]|uniref:spermidine N1-acetyltransferase n=1 Tax=Lampropedia cohaerens TaxID=1610491 RepID=UPI000A07D419|nr:spermidine N1-acetyltransferase [Lampropedia cohaerens]